MKIDRLIGILSILLQKEMITAPELAMLYAARCFMHRTEKSVPYIIVAGFRMVFILAESVINCLAI